MELKLTSEQTNRTKYLRRKRPGTDVLGHLLSVVARAGFEPATFHIMSLALIPSQQRKSTCQELPSEPWRCSRDRNASASSETTT